MPTIISIAEFITDFADQAVVLPLTVLIAAALYASGWRRGAIVWTTVILGTFALMLVLKLGFGACGRYIADGQIESPSGHTAAAGVFYGSIFAYIAERIFGRGVLTVLVILSVVIVVGLSRVLLGAHTVPEVAVGAAVGIVAALLLVRGAGEPMHHSRLRYLLLPACAILFLFHGIHLPAEAAIRTFARGTWPLSVCRDGQAGGTRLRPTVAMPALRVLTTSWPRHGLVM